MLEESESVHLELQMSMLRACAEDYVKKINRTLPVEFCPKCGEDSHVPGLLCPGCGYRHPQGWLLIRSTEWGYQVVPINRQRVSVAEFRLPMPRQPEL